MITTSCPGNERLRGLLQLDEDQLYWAVRLKNWFKSHFDGPALPRCKTRWKANTACKFFLLAIGTLGGIRLRVISSHITAVVIAIKPILKIKCATVKEFDVNDLTQRLSELHAKHEIHQSIETFNHLLSEWGVGRDLNFKRVYRALRPTCLRTPLTVIEGHANLINQLGKAHSIGNHRWTLIISYSLQETGWSSLWVNWLNLRLCGRTGTVLRIQACWIILTRLRSRLNMLHKQQNCVIEINCEPNKQVNVKKISKLFWPNLPNASLKM